MNLKNEPELRLKCVIDCLLMYWQKNPKASDTLEGISHWWIKNPEIQAEWIHEALQVLCKDGVAHSVKAADGRIRYRLNQKQ